MGEEWYDSGASPKTEWERYAQMFVQSLIDGEYQRAYAELSSELKSEMDETLFKTRFLNIVSVDDVPLGPAEVIMSLDDYPDMRSNETGNAYVHVGGDNNEAMSVFVGRRAAGYEVVAMSWGRP